jgi:hypothetical protein
MQKITLLLLLSTASQAQPPATRVEQIIQSHVAAHTFMGTVLIAKGDTVVLDKGFGYAN